MSTSFGTLALERRGTRDASALRILVAPAPYKECLDAVAVANAIEVGIRRVDADAKVTKLPVCDGGTGIVDRFIEAKGGQRIRCQIHGPMMNFIESDFGILSDGTAVIESAKAAGLALVPSDARNPLLTSTYGVGDLIKKAYRIGCRNFIVGCGDSATNDGGVGMAQSLGVRFYDDRGELLGQGGGELKRLARIETSELSINAREMRVMVACNLTSILCGPGGTSRRYAAQKGASPASIEVLNAAMDRYADALALHLGWDLRYLPGTGGSGGLGAGLLAFLSAELHFSMNLVCRVLSVEDFLQQTDILITGEGMVDTTSATGKAPCALGLLAKKYGVPTVSIVGSIGDDSDIVYFHGLDMVESILRRPMSMVEALTPKVATALIADAASRVMRFLNRRRLNG